MGCLNPASNVPEYPNILHSCCQVDIEGFEVPLLSELRDWHILPRQLSIELHFRQKGFPFPEVAPASPLQMALLVSHLAQLGYGPVFREGRLGWAGALATG